MKTLINRIRNTEFLTFNEVLRLKVVLVTAFLLLFVGLTIPISALLSFNFQFSINIIVPIFFIILLLITIITVILNFNRVAMHFSIYTMIGLTVFHVGGANHLYGFILFFVSLTIIIFYQDIITYIIYGGAVTFYGSIYAYQSGGELMGVLSSSEQVSVLTYQIMLIGFYVIFLIQFILSDHIYEKLNNEWVRMNKILEKYQDFSLQHLNEYTEKKKATPIYKNTKFQQTISELAVFLNEFFEENGEDIAELVEFYFFLHTQEIDQVVENEEASNEAKIYAEQLRKYLLNKRSELTSMLYDFSTLFIDQKVQFNSTRYLYSIDDLFTTKTNKMLALAILYKFLRTEVTQFDKWGNIGKILNHDEITELFVSKEFREFISFEQVNFYLDNQELFEKYL
ncbi:MAG: hypothetical protein ACVCEJ_05350 [Candidatus Izemoplasmataceae bacterium]